MEGQGRPRAGWRTWAALAWALAFGLLYAVTVIESRAPALRRAILGAPGR